MRNLARDIENMAKVLAEVFRLTKPGGYLELAEFGGGSPAPLHLRMLTVPPRRSRGP